MSENKVILKSASVISIATLFSRVLGFIRDILIAAFFGTGAVSEAFFVAFRIPNLLRDLVGEGAVNSAFVPVFCQYWAKEDKKQFWNLIGNVFWVILIILTAISFLGILFSRAIVSVIAPGFLKEASKFLLTVQLTKVLFPYLLLIGLTAFAIGFLHSFRFFISPALSPCLLNICMIASIVIAYRFMDNPIFGLALGVLIGGVFQIGIQIPSLARRGFNIGVLKVKFNFLHPGIKKIGSLLLPRIFGTAVYQLNVLIDTILASLSFIVGQGGVAAIYFANRVVQLPLALFGIALSSAILPTLSQQAVVRDMDSLRLTIRFSLRTIYFLMLPTVLGLVILTQPIIEVLFQRGHFDYYSVRICSSALYFYAMGLLFFGGMKILTAGFYSLQDTRTPVIIASLALLINFLLNIILMFPLKIGGLALASSLSAAFNFSFLYFNLTKRIGRIITKDLLIYFLKVSCAGLIMCVSILIFFNKTVFLNPILRLSLTIILGVLIYFSCCFVFRIERIDKLFRWIRPN